MATWSYATAERVDTRRMPTEPSTPTVYDVVKRAAEAADHAQQNDGVDDLLRRFEDADEPVTSVEDFEQRISEVAGAIDPQQEDAAVVMAVATAVYLAHRRDELPEGRTELLHLAAEAEFEGRPPDHVARWLEQQGAA